MKNSQPTLTDAEIKLHDRITAEREPVIEILREHGAPDLTTAVSYAAYVRVLLDNERQANNKLFAELKKSVQIVDAMMSLGNEMLAQLHTRNLHGEEEAEVLENIRATLASNFSSIVPLAERGAAWTDAQRRNGFKRFEDERKKHDQWLAWQANEIKSNPKFASYSVSEQARRLKRKHNIDDAAPTIAKRLTPKNTSAQIVRTQPRLANPRFSMLHASDTE